MGSLVPMKSYGANSYDKKLEQAIIKVKQLFNITDAYDKFDSQINSHSDNTYFYLNWSDSKGKFANININTDVNGNITSFSKYLSKLEEPKSKLPNITKEEGIKKSLEFISKIDKDIAKSIKVKENTNAIIAMDTDYRYEFIRYVNDIAFPDNNVSISINKYSGEVTAYYVNWERKLSFPTADKAMSLEQAKKAYIDNIGLKLMYKSSDRVYRISDDKAKDAYYIAYSPLQPTRAIDANTGKPVDINGYEHYDIARDMMSKEETMDGLSPEEQLSVDKLSGILEITAIEKKAREILKIDENYKMKDSHLNSDYRNQGDYRWTLEFIKNIDKDKVLIANISLDAKTGELLNFYNYKSYDESTKAKISKSEALDIAKSYLKKINPDKEKQVEYLPNDHSTDNSLTHNFEFSRKIDGIYVENDIINIGVDSVSRVINSYNLEWYKGKLPSSDNIISIDKAYEILWDKIGYELTYVNSFDYTNPGEENKEIKLVYSIKPGKPAIISSITGEILDYAGKPYKQSKISNYTDIDKSYAKDKIKLLSEYGVSFQGNEFKPKEKMKQKDFVYLLWKSINPYTTDNVLEDDIYNEFIGIGYMTEKEKNPDKIVTKEEATKYIIKVMKLDKIAEINGIYKDIFKDEKDISKDLKGYINIGYGLKIISGDGSGNIKPKQELKREDAANMIYNYLFN